MLDKNSAVATTPFPALCTNCQHFNTHFIIYSIEYGWEVDFIGGEMVVADGSDAGGDGDGGDNNSQRT